MLVYHWLPSRWLDAMRPEGCAIQYAAGGLDALLEALLTWSTPSRGGKVAHTLSTRPALARSIGRDTNKPDAWSRPVPPRRYYSMDDCLLGWIA